MSDMLKAKTLKPNAPPQAARKAKSLRHARRVFEAAAAEASRWRSIQAWLATTSLGFRVYRVTVAFRV